MKLMLKLNLLVITLLFAAKGYGQKKIDTYTQIDSLLVKEFKNQKFNGNVLVVQKDKTVYEKSFGYADPSRKVELNKGFKFLIGSIYKEFPAVAIMQLYEKGLINLEDNIDKFVPELPSWSKDISIKNLLQYSGGLPDIQTKKYPADKIITTEDVFNDLINTKQLLYKPGTSYLYTNYSPLLLMKIVEKVTHQSFNKYAGEHLFTSDDIVIKGQYPYLDVQLMAIAFNKDFQADPIKVAIPFLFVSNTRGLYDWFKRVDQNVLINQKSQLFLGKTANILTDKSMQSPFGNIKIYQEPLSDDTKILEHTHDGSFGNSKCIARRFNNQDLTIIILTNQNNNNVRLISDEIYKIVGQ